jgi:hypothetical protein
LPQEISRAAFGPRSQATVVILTTGKRVSRGGITELTRDLFGARLSADVVDATQRPTVRQSRLP